ncbi:MAG TPA: FAD-binding oxidoreductase [Microthrixaceae bacterium]|nr:FAD-binding oxidoreductase [Microthrixaceae bacterium]
MSHPAHPPGARLDALTAELRDQLGAAHVVDDPDVVASASQDWTGRFGSPAALVVRPGSTEEVAAVLVACGRARIPVVPQGGNTGLVGGGVPRGGEVLVSLGRLDELKVDDESGEVVAGAGVTLAAVQHGAARAGWRYAIDFGARQVATVGGMVATDAGGVGVFRHGSTRRQVLGLEVVMAGGEVVSHLSGPLKDGAGFRVADLVCGSEGTLAVVTRARLRLIPAPSRQVVVFAGFEHLDRALGAAGRSRSVPEVDAIEFIGPECLAGLVESGSSVPVAVSGWALLVSAAGERDVTDALADAMSGATGAAVADDARAARELWDLRDAVPEVIRRIAPPLKFDVAVPTARLGSFLHQLPIAVASIDPAADVWRFGHAADGNVHVNVTGARSSEADLERAVFELVLDAGGSLAAEHGVGIAKAKWMPRARTEVELEAMARIKTALDPDRLLNPGVLGL